MDLLVRHWLDVAVVQVSLLEEGRLLDGICSYMVSHCGLTFLRVDPLAFSPEEGVELLLAC